MAIDTFDPAEGPSAEQQAAEAAALAQGEKLAEAQEAAREQALQQNENENEDIQLIAGKFKSQDELLKAYEELQKKLGTNEPDEEEEPVEEQEEAEEVEVDEGVKSFREINNRFEENGQLTQEDYDSLVQMDSKQLIETYFKYFAEQNKAVAAQAATAQELQQIRDAVGGNEAYQEMITWAGNNLSEDEINQFNAVTATNQTAAIAYAVESLNNRFRASEGYEAPLVTGKRPSSKKDVFRSQAELARAIADPRYSSDHAYRSDVEEKLARSGDIF